MNVYTIMLHEHYGEGLMVVAARTEEEALAVAKTPATDGGYRPDPRYWDFSKPLLVGRALRGQKAGVIEHASHSG